ncbi:hypothetical protein, partial [Olsenella sp. An293]|uniref:hypothetical protein n=1 Tax=Olsenella sp. An293 TaxID=1965626 RepID=UPI000B557587
MTACTNNGGKARRVVTAALVGVLSVGAVPAIALATGTGDAAGSEVSVLAVAIWDGATIASATNGQPNESVSEEDLKNGVSFESDSHEYLVPTALVIDGETQRVKDDWAVTYTMDTYSSDPSTAASFTGLTMGWEYYDASRGTGSMFTFNGTLSADQAAAYFGGTLRGNKGQVVSVLPGTYHVTVSGAVDGTAGSATFNFKVVSPAPEQHTYTVEGNLTYDGFDKKGELTFRNEDGIAETPTAWKNGDGSTHTGAITDAGTYFAVMPGGEQVKFVVEQLDLSAATVTIEDIVSPDSDGNGYGDIMSNAYVLSKVKVGGYDVSDAVIKIGERQDAVNYRFGVNTVTILPAAGDSANIKGFASVTFTVLNDSVFSGAHRLMYGDEDITGSRVINVSSYDREAFDSSKLSVVFDGVTYSGEQLDVTVDGDLTKQGPHTVHVRVEPFQKDGVWYGGTQDITVWVSRADLDADERLYFYLDGKLAGNGATVTYDGGDWLDRLEVVVRDANGNELVNGEDYDVTVTKGGSEVDSAVDAGTYKVKVTGKTFDFQYGGVDTFTLNVSQLVIDRIVPVWDLDVEGTPDGYLYYTGDVLTPAYRFFDWVDDEYVEVEVPAEAYEVTYMKGGKDVDLKEVGTYTADFDTAVDEKNYVVDKDVRIDVTDKKIFLDVPANEWYSQGVYDAVKLGYMNGDGGGKTFG